MTSNALAALEAGLAEISALQRSNPRPSEGGGLRRPDVVRALGRAEVVLLSSHLERYIYALIEESVTYIEQMAVPAERLTDEFRLVHARTAIEDIASIGWDRRGERLREYSRLEAGLWIDAQAVTSLDASRLLGWMRAPTCKAIVRVFRMWGIPDIFSAITRGQINRQRLWLRISELVDKRNNIAHGDLTVEARYLDVAQYASTVKLFCRRVDKRMARQLRSLAGAASVPW